MPFDVPRPDFDSVNIRSVLPSGNSFLFSQTKQKLLGVEGRLGEEMGGGSAETNQSDPEKPVPSLDKILS